MENDTESGWEHRSTPTPSSGLHDNDQFRIDAGTQQRYFKHELLGSRIPESGESEPSWQNTLGVGKIPWLAQYVLLDQIVFPAAAYIALAEESLRQLSKGNLDSYTVRDFSITSALFLKPESETEIRTTLRPMKSSEKGNHWYDVQIMSYDEGHWVERCKSKISALIAPSSDLLGIVRSRRTLQREVSRAYWYDVLESKGLKYGSALQGLYEIAASPTGHEAVAVVPLIEDEAGYALPPVILDQCLQAIMVAACKGQGRLLRGLSTVTAIEHLAVFSSGRATYRIEGVALRSRSGSWMGDVSAMSEDGHPKLVTSGCESSVIVTNRPEFDNKLFSFVKWDKDATYSNLNQIAEDPHAPSGCAKVSVVLKLLAHKNPKLKILELGNGGDEITRSILDALQYQHGERLYLSYTYAISTLDAAFMAKRAFRRTPSMNVVFFNTEEQPQDQLLEAEAYDLIIISNFFSLTRETKAHYVDYLRYFIHPLGHLIMLETLSGASPPKDTHFVNQVHTSLLNGGFVFSREGDDSPEGPDIVAKLKKPLKYPKKISLIATDDHHPFFTAVQTSLQESDIECNLYNKFEGNIPQDQDMIITMDLSEPYLYNITEAEFRVFVDCMSKFKRSIIWVIPAAQISCANPNSSMTLGMTRTLRAELRKDITVVEIDIDPSTFVSSSKSLVKIYQGLGYRTKGASFDPDMEFVIDDGEIKIPRFHWTTGEEELSNCMDYSKTDGNGSQIIPVPNNGSPVLARFRSNACYLLVGGLGGLGRMISTWMVQHGARNILFLSRSAKEGPETTPFFDELRAQGCEVSTFAGSVANFSDVETAVKQATSQVAGVIQMSAVMRDNFMSHMSFTDWDQCVRPKVQGTWNLHQATSSIELDFFLLFSSICGISGQWGQANYNAANSFLDAFVNFRHGRGLPAAVVDIGFMGGVGMAVENKALVEKLTASGYYFLEEQDLIDAITIALAHPRPREGQVMNKSQLSLGLRSAKPITDPKTRVVWKRDARMVLSHQFGSLRTTSDEEAEECIRAVYSKPSTHVVGQ